MKPAAEVTAHLKRHFGDLPVIWGGSGPTLVAILVTHDAVDDVEKTNEDGGPLARFSKHRDKFELAASAKHQRGQFEEDGLVIVDVADLKGAGH